MLRAVRRELNIREMPTSLGKLESVFEENHQLIITRNQQPIARVLPIPPARKTANYSRGYTGFTATERYFISGVDPPRPG